ncbi:MAG TPA: chemotaxis protein CheA [Gallionella sp.]|nr:chemotaxis protein CheA [Gallionella sp.]
MSMDQALQTFFAESRELLQQMEDLLLQLEHTPDDGEAINAMFRAAHTIKGSAGMFGLDQIVSFTHTVENMLDRVRDGHLHFNSDLVAELLLCRDHMEMLVDHAIAGGGKLNADQQHHGDVLTAKLIELMGGNHADDHAKNAAQMPALRDDRLESSGGSEVSSDTWHLSLRFGKDVLRNGMDPLSFIRYLTTLGEIVSLHTILDAMPDADSMDPESCYLGFEIALKSDADKKTIEDVFEFVRDDCLVHILPPRSKIREYLELIRTLPEEDELLGGILVKIGAITQKELDEGLTSQWFKDAPLGEILVEQQTVQRPVVDAALDKQKQVKEAKVQEGRFIRVQADKLDDLINLVGELVIAGASANLLAQRTKDSTLQEATSRVSGLVEEIRDGALKLRMVEIGETFNRFQRVVRDTSKELGKDIHLEINGADTELDKTVVEKIGDPLMHLVRNSMDHGIESKELREQRGKPAKGTLRLNAFHDSGSIVIEVGDDGGGLNRERILNKAIERGLVTTGQTLSDREVYNLIFEPGFSTAAQVTNLSGRGVGMDVVRRNIESLRGTVDLDSEEGRGTTVRIRLPLTLAIIDGFLVGVGGAAYIVPLDMVLECVDLAGEAQQDSRDHNYMNLRGEVLPFVRLRDQFDVEGKAGRRENVVVVRYGGQKAGLVVDELLGEYQTVIKPLGKVFSGTRGIGGFTILGSGEVALILDVPSLIQQAAKKEGALTGVESKLAVNV